MGNNTEDLNRYQIIRKDARGCFVETKSDCFDRNKVHLEFSKYDMARPAGERQIDHVHIYIDVPEFLHLSHEAMSGTLHLRAAGQREKSDPKPLYEHLGGTSAQRLAQFGKSRPDGKSLSHIVKLICGQKADYLFAADSGPGETDAKGLIVPKFGKNPENHVSVSLSRRSLNELLLMTQVHYEAWLSARYANTWDIKPQPPGDTERPQTPAGTTAAENRQETGKVDIIDTQIDLW
jgi:hypothetical protein